MNSKKFKFEADPFAKDAQSTSKTYHEVLNLKTILLTKPQVKNTNNNYYDLYYTPIKNRDGKVMVIDKYNNKENDYINFDDFLYLIIIYEINLEKQH